MAGALSPSDPSSFSRPEDFLLTHLHLELDVDFDQHTLKGSTKLNFERKSDDARSVLLDTRDLKIHSIKDGNGKDLKFTLEKPVLSFGSKLEIKLEDPPPTKFTLVIEYETSPNSTALQWLPPAQTAGKEHPYMFSQCQAIHARSLVPCQDSPGIKMPYTAKISAPSELTVLMSAIRDGQESHPTDSNKKMHKFVQKVPIPSYLIAIVVGALESREIGPRSKVWSEKEMVEDAAYEFAETEQMIATGEELLGPYVWGIYDLLVLPPSFPYGGMENPCLTFVTPTLLAGDRSLADVVAHEIAHSWTGNLVTNKNSEHFWLNEGHTVFCERKIAGHMHGEKFRHFAACGGWKDLQYQIDVFGPDHPFTHLVPKLDGVDPDDAFSSVPYEKGSSLLMYLENLLGGPAVFEPFLRSYIEKFKYKSITTDDWKAFLYEFFHGKKYLLDKVDWEAWFHKPGMPPVKPDLDTSLADVSAALAEKWSSASEKELDQFKAAELSNLSSFQHREFLATLLEKPPLSADKIRKMEELYHFNAVKNSEIRFRWLRLCLRAEFEDAIELALKFVTEQGRMKFVRPIYRDLYQWETSREQAIKHFKKTSEGMHILTATMVGKDLKLRT